MGYNQYNQLITNSPKFTEPVSENTLMRGAMYQEGLAQQSKSDFQSSIDPIFNIRAISSADEKILRQKQQELQGALGGINMSQLSNPQSKGQINSIINQFKNDQDILAVATRSGQYFNELATKKDYESKGKQYVSPLLRQADKYIKDGVYKRDTRFNKSGFVAPDNKELDEIAKNTPEWENFVTKGGYDYNLKGKAEDKLYQNYLTHFSNNPQWSQLLNDQFEQDAENINIEDLHNQGIEGIRQMFPYLPADAQEQALADMEEGIQIQQSNPYVQGAWKDKLRDDYFKNQAYMAAQAKTYANTVDKKANEYAKSANDFEEAKQLELYKLQVKTGLVQNEGETGASYVKRLSDAALEYDKQLYQQRQDIKVEGTKEMDDYKTENRKELIDYKNAVSPTSNYSSNAAKRVILGLGDGTFDVDKDKTALIGMIANNKANLFNPSNGNKLKDPEIVDIKVNPTTEEVEIEYEVVGNNATYTYKYDDILNVLKDGKSTTPKLSEEEWNTKWNQLKAGESMTGLDGKTYTKQ